MTLRAFLVVATAAAWLLAAASLVGWGPYPAGERHCDDWGCWQEVER